MWYHRHVAGCRLFIHSPDVPCNFLLLLQFFYALMLGHHSLSPPRRRRRRRCSTLQAHIPDSAAFRLPLSASYAHPSLAVLPSPRFSHRWISFFTLPRHAYSLSVSTSRPITACDSPFFPTFVHLTAFFLPFPLGALTFYRWYFVVRLFPFCTEFSFFLHFGSVCTLSGFFFHH